tara:strand:- start:150 stop:782 length:633 start_codon:yes stop_codon:yes gene_type:complete
MRAANLPDRKLTVDEFLAWTERDPETRFDLGDGLSPIKSDVKFELHDGHVVAMTPERLIHVDVKSECWLALRNALRPSHPHCRAYIDGLGVRIDETTEYQPDALVRCGDPLSPDTRSITDPIIVVEVLSPSTQSKDLGLKLEHYFQLASVQHYLIVDPDRRRVIHHQRREADDALLTRILAEGRLRLDPPGIELQVDDILPPPPPDESED